MSENMVADIMTGAAIILEGAVYGRVSTKSSGGYASISLPKEPTEEDWQELERRAIKDVSRLIAHMRQERMPKFNATFWGIVQEATT